MGEKFYVEMRKEMVAVACLTSVTEDKNCHEEPQEDDPFKKQNGLLEKLKRIELSPFGLSPFGLSPFGLSPFGVEFFRG